MEDVKSDRGIEVAQRQEAHPAAGQFPGPVGAIGMVDPLPETPSGR